LFTTGFAATLAAAGLLAIGLATVFGAVLEAATLEAGVFEPVAFAAVFAVLLGIELLLFLEDLALEDLAAEVAFRVSLREARAWLFGTLRLAATAFLEPLEELLDLRVFCDTACARNCHAPVRCDSREPIGAKAG